jgi:hypothetical protein
MKIFFSRLGRFVWSRGFLTLVLAVAALIVLLYVEENWRGGHELAGAKARWQRAGYSLTPSDYYPPSVPDNQNLAALPYFVLESDPKYHGELLDLHLRAAISDDQHGGELYDYDKKRQLPELVAAAYAKKFPGQTAPASLVTQLEELYPILTDLRSASTTRPEFRLNQDYAYQPVWERPFALVVDQIRVAKLLGYHAQLALRENQPPVALDDIRIGFQIASGVGQDPTLVGGLVALGVAAITRANVDEGLGNHVWNDAQLAQLQDALKRLDCLALYQFDFRSEVVVMTVPLYAQIRNRPDVMRLMFGMSDDDGMSPLPAAPFVFWRAWPGGWWDMNCAQSVDFSRRESACVDPKARRVDAGANLRLRAELEKAKELPGVLAPWRTFFVVGAGPLAGICIKFAQGQVQLDEDRIVCGLERYRLTHGSYPPNLDALVPACIDELPHDIINGEPYRYRLKPDGTFLLYSVGWNQSDEGGILAEKPDNPNAINFEQGDWVWPMVKR